MQPCQPVYAMSSAPLGLLSALPEIPAALPATGSPIAKRQRSVSRAQLASGQGIPPQHSAPFASCCACSAMHSRNRSCCCKECRHACALSWFLIMQAKARQPCLGCMHASTAASGAASGAKCRASCKMGVLKSPHHGGGHRLRVPQML